MTSPAPSLAAGNAAEECALCTIDGEPSIDETDTSTSDGKGNYVIQIPPGQTTVNFSYDADVILDCNSDGAGTCKVCVDANCYIFQNVFCPVSFMTTSQKVSLTGSPVKNMTVTAPCGSYATTHILGGTATVDANTPTIYFDVTVRICGTGAVLTEFHRQYKVVPPATNCPMQPMGGGPEGP